MIQKLLLISVLSFCFVVLQGQDVVIVDKGIYKVNYSQKLEQPLKVIYTSSNRPTNVNRGAMDFYVEPHIVTSDGKDYDKNDYDKGHMAPAATFSDNMENLKKTFSYLNCALQHKDLNRKQWKLLEETERIWDNSENLVVEVDAIFSKGSKKLPTGATIPDYFEKHIYFTKQKKYVCFRFPNSPVDKEFRFYEFKCQVHK